MLEFKKKKNLLVILFLSIILLIVIFKLNGKNKENFTNVSKPKKAKKIITFSLWGNNECYNWGAVENALLAQTIYPGWICRFYVSQDIIPEVKKILLQLNNVEVIEMNEDRGSGNMFWRFKPMFEEDNNIVLSRDTDSRLNQREKKAVEEWLKTKKDLLILRNHKFHFQLIMGGMFGVKNNVFRPFEKKFKLYMNKKKQGKYMDDQIFLRDIYQELKKQNKLMIYDSHYHFKDEKVNPFPESDFQGYIGQIVCNDFTLTNEKYHKNLKNTNIEKPYPIPEDSKV